MVSNASDSRCTNASAVPNARAVVLLGIKWATFACELKAKCIISSKQTELASGDGPVGSSLALFCWH